MASILTGQRSLRRPDGAIPFHCLHSFAKRSGGLVGRGVLSGKELVPPMQSATLSRDGKGMGNATSGSVGCSRRFARVAVFQSGSSKRGFKLRISRIYTDLKGLRSHAGAPGG